MLNRRALLGSAIAAAAATSFRSPSHAAPAYTIKVGNQTPETHPLTIRMREAAAQIREDTSGAVEIQIFAHSVLGGDTDMLSQLRSGALEMMTLSGNVLSTLVPHAGVSGVAFALPNYETVWRAMDGELGNYMRKAIEGAGLVALDKVWDNGFRQITSSSRPIKTAEDLKGFKIRVPVSPMWISTFESLGASPVSINPTELYTALQTRVVDGQENALVVIDTYKLFEVQKYVSLSRHVWEGFYMLANGRMWRRLPENYRESITMRFNEAALRQRADVEAAEARLQPILTQRGMIFNSTEPDSFRSILTRAGYYEKWKKTYGNEAWANLEKYSGQLV